MKVIVVVVFALFCVVQPCVAQQRDDNIRNGNRKITIGLVMMGAGALVAPLTAVTEASHNDSAVMATGIGLIGAGSILVWLGATERRHPQTTIGLSFGRKAALQIRRIW